MNDFVEFCITGASFGAAYALLALSVNVVYSSSNILNFAQGEFMMLGGMLGWVFYTKTDLPYVVVLLLIVVVMAGVGLVEYYGIAAPLLRRRAALISIIIATLGFSIVLRTSTELVLGGVARPAKPPLGSDAVPIGDAAIAPQSFVILTVVTIALAVIWWVYSRTTVGIALRAAAFQPDGARLVGVNVSRTIAITFASGAALAALAGFLVSPLSFASPFLGLDFAVQGFAAAIIGGLGSWPGAVVGGLALGLSRSFLSGYVNPDWANMLTFGLILLMLYVRPTGIFRERLAV